jgi:hypothetical protein
MLAVPAQPQPRAVRRRKAGLGAYRDVRDDGRPTEDNAVRRASPRVARNSRPEPPNSLSRGSRLGAARAVRKPDKDHPGRGLAVRKDQLTKIPILGNEHPALVEREPQHRLVASSPDDIAHRKHVVPVRAKRSNDRRGAALVR